jgi:DNA-binding response OmpR family regulator
VPASSLSTIVRVFVLEPKPDLRRAVEEVLGAEGYTVESCTSLQDLLTRSSLSHCDLALTAWQSMEGLLADEHRHDLVQLASRIPLVIMVPRSWLRALQPLDLAVRGLLAKPFDAEELLECVSRSIGAAAPRPSAAFPAQRQPHSAEAFP